MELQDWVKVFLYCFDVGSDFLNGYKLLTKIPAVSNTTTFTITVPKTFAVLTKDTFASYFHKGRMWCGVKVEKSRKNGFSYDKAIFWQNL